MLHQASRLLPYAIFKLPCEAFHPHHADREMEAQGSCVMRTPGVPDPCLPSGREACGHMLLLALVVQVAEV